MKLKTKGHAAATSTRLAKNFLLRLASGQFLDRTNQPKSNTRHTALPGVLKKWTKQKDNA